MSGTPPLTRAQARPNILTGGWGQGGSGLTHRSTIVTVGDQERRRYVRSWKLAASLLGIAALVVAGVAVNLVVLAAPLELVIYFAVVAVVLVGGTLWLVPGRRADHP